MKLNKLKELMYKNNISYAIVSSISTGILENIGTTDELQYDTIVNQLFGDYEQIKILDESLKGQKMPRSWGQGDTICLVCKPNLDVLIALFYNEHRHILESVKFGEKMANEIDCIWK